MKTKPFKMPNLVWIKSSASIERWTKVRSQEAEERRAERYQVIILKWTLKWCEKLFTKLEEAACIKDDYLGLILSSSFFLLINN